MGGVLASPFSSAADRPANTNPVIIIFSIIFIITSTAPLSDWRNSKLDDKMEAKGCEGRFGQVGDMDKRGLVYFMSAPLT